MLSKEVISPLPVVTSSSSLIVYVEPKRNLYICHWRAILLLFGPYNGHMYRSEPKTFEFVRSLFMGLVKRYPCLGNYFLNHVVLELCDFWKALSKYVFHRCFSIATVSFFLFLPDSIKNNQTVSEKNLKLLGIIDESVSSISFPVDLKIYPFNLSN